MVGSLSGMDSQMSFEVAFLVESSFAFFKRADKFFLTQMGFEMNIKSLLSRVGLVTTLVCAFEFFLTLVSLEMIIQMTLSHEGLVTTLLRTWKGSIGLLIILSCKLVKLTYVYFRMLYQ